MMRSSTTESVMSQVQVATLLFAAPFLILSVVYTVGIIVLGDHQ